MSIHSTVIEKWGMSVHSTVIEKWGMSIQSTVIEKWGMSIRSTVIEKWGMSVRSNPKFGCAFFPPSNKTILICQQILKENHNKYPIGKIWIFYANSQT